LKGDEVDSIPLAADPYLSPPTGRIILRDFQKNYPFIGDILINQVLKQFSEYLNIRLENDRNCTEDSVRYTFFASLLKSTNISPHEIFLEYPYNTQNKLKLDVYVNSKLFGSRLAIEFKYDRKNPSGQNSNRTQKAGSLFNDISKLRNFDSREKLLRFLIYLTDDEMAVYLSGRHDILKKFLILKRKKISTLGRQVFQKCQKFSKKKQVMYRQRGLFAYGLRYYRRAINLKFSLLKRVSNYLANNNLLSQLVAPLFGVNQERINDAFRTWHMAN
jgi:hypothetical protein